MRKELLTKLTWTDFNPPVVISDGYNTMVNYKIAFDSWGNTFALVQGYLDPNEADYDIADDNFICFMVDNKDDEFCMQGGYPTIEQAIEAIEYIAKNGEAPKGFYAL